MVINTRHGIINIHYPNDYICRSLQLTGEYEWYVVDIISKLCADYDTGAVLDIGSNIGIVCLPIARQYPNYKVYAFDAQAHMCELLKENIALNKLDNISVEPYALGDQTGIITLSHPDYAVAENIGAFSLDTYVQGMSNIARGNGEVAVIDVRTLDSIEFAEPIRCIKLDVEGFEERIIRGGLETLKKHNYPPIVYELWSYNPWWKENAASLRSLLESLGYKIAAIDDTAIAIHQ